MILGNVLDTIFSTESTLTGAPQDSGAAPVSTVYVNGVAIAPGAPPVVANLAVGRYSLVYALSGANGHAANDWVSITEDVTLDGFAITRPVWEGNLIQAGADVTALLGQTIYPMFTTHSPATGANQDLDAAANPTFVVYRNLVATAIVPALTHPAVGVWTAAIPLTVVGGWAAGDQVDVIALGTVNAIAAESCIFSGGLVVDTVGGGAAGTAHHEVLGHALRVQ